MDTILLTPAIALGQLVKLPIGTAGGLVALDVVVIVLCVFGVWRTKFKLSSPPIWIKASLLFILIALISLILTPLTLTTLEYFTSAAYIVRFLLYILLGWLIYSDIFTNLKKNIQNVLLLSGVVLASLGLLQLIFLPDLQFLTLFGWDPHYARTVSTFLDPNFLGAYLVLTLLLLFARPQLLLIAVVYLALLTTFSRGAYLAFLTSFLTLSALKKSPRLAIITIVLFAGLMMGFTTYQRFLAQPRGVDRTQSAQSRFDTWQQGLKLFQSHPILGVGFNAYKFALREYNLADENFLKSRGSSTNDSSFLYVAATTGILGLIFYFFFLLTLIRTKQPVLVAAVLGLLSQSFFANTLFYPHLLVWIILIASKFHLSKDQKK